MFTTENLFLSNNNLCTKHREDMENCKNEIAVEEVMLKFFADD